MTDAAVGGGMVDDEGMALERVELRLNPGVAYREGNRRWQGIPGIERTVGGRYWAAWYTGGRTEDSFNHVVLVTSEDDGRTWTDPVLVIDPPGDVRAADPVLWCDPGGRIWLFWMQTAHCGVTFDGRAGVWGIWTEEPERADCGWSSPVRIAHGVMMNKPTVLSTGEWLLPCAVWSGREYRHHLPEERFSNVIVSRDAGRTFEVLGRADVPCRTCDEHMIVERLDGTLWMLVRRSDGIGEAISSDRGRTWVASPDIVFPGPNSRFHIRRLRSGRLLLINHHEFTGRNNLTAFLSEDDGRTWPYRLLLDERDSVSYPDAVEDAGGRIHVIYDRSRVGEGEILLQTFTEEDVIAGVGGGYRQRRPVVISRVRRREVGAEWLPLAADGVLDQRYGIAVGGSDDQRGHGALWIVPENGEDGAFSTGPIWIRGKRMEVAAEIEQGGEILIQLEDWSGKSPHPGFGMEDCVPLMAGSSEQFVTWKEGGNVEHLGEDVVRVRFRLRRARISAIRFV